MSDPVALPPEEGSRFRKAGDPKPAYAKPAVPGAKPNDASLNPLGPAQPTKFQHEKVDKVAMRKDQENAFSGAITSSDPELAPLGTVQNAAHYVLNQMGEVPKGFNNCFAYLARVQLKGSNFASISVLVHTRLFSEADFKAMLDEACKLCEDMRLSQRRKGARVPPGAKIGEINEMYFDSDSKFVEALMCDKFDFRVLAVLPATSGIQATVVEASQA